MQQNQNAYVRIVDGVTTFIARYVKYLGYVILLLLVFEVISRRFFHAPTDWNFWVTKEVFAVYFLLIAPYGMLRQTNIRIDIFYANWSQRTKDIVNLIGLALVWCTVDIIVIIYGSAYAINAYKVNELTASVAYQMPYWPFKGLIIVAYILLLFQAISEIIKILQRLLAKGEKV